MSIAQHKETVRLLFEEDISRGNEAVSADIIHPDFFDHTNPPGMQHGLKGHLAIVRLFRAAFPDQWWQIEDLIAEDDKVVARTTMTATHTGDFFGIPPTGRPVTLTGVHILRLQEGRIAEHWGSNDDLGLMRQLGVIPDPAAVAAT
jgi:predicted ester cyclase